MNDKSKKITQRFSSSDEKIAYLERKNLFLLEYIEELADKKVAEDKMNIIIQIRELIDIKHSLSWRLTKPFRKLNRILKILKRKYIF